MVIIRTSDGEQSFPVLDLLVLYIFEKLDLEVDDFQDWVQEEFDASVSIPMLRKARNRSRTPDNSGPPDDLS